jgi:NADH:ubiquinone oxidoreductase subunit E
MGQQVPSPSTQQWREKIAEQFQPSQDQLIPILQFIEAEAGFLAPEAMLAAGRHLRVAESQVYGVASFYSQFHFEPQGKFKVTICRGTACHVLGSGRLEEEVATHLGIKPGGTTPDLLFTVESVACVGSCALAPVVVLNKKVLGRQSVSSLKKAVDDLRE